MNPTPPPGAIAEQPFRAGLTLPRDIVIAPARAYAAIAARSNWLPAYAALVTIGLISGFLEWPALAHVASVVPDADGHVPHGATALETASRTLLANVLISQALTPLIFMGLTATVLTVVARFKGDRAPYGVFVALAAACLVPATIGDLLGAVVVRAHDPAAYHDYRSIILAIPDNLGVFAAKGNDKELFFLSRFGIFEVWSYTLLAFGIAALVPVRFMTAAVVAFTLGFVLSVTV